jgi:hypothetical protein
LIRSKYPDVKFWTRKEWLENIATNEDITTVTENPRRGRVRASQGINVTMGYVEKEDGEVVDGHAASDIRKCAHSIWVHIATTETGPPAKWSEAGIKHNEEYRMQMYQRFPMLQLCESDWKVDQIATDNYPSWYSSWRKKVPGATIKAEQDSVPLDSHIPKRPHEASTSAEPDPKKRKVKLANGKSDEIERRNSSISRVESHLGSNLPVWNSVCYCNHANVIIFNSSITHYLRC